MSAKPGRRRQIHNSKPRIALGVGEGCLVAQLDGRTTNQRTLGALIGSVVADTVHVCTGGDFCPVKDR